METVVKLAPPILAADFARLGDPGYTGGTSWGGPDSRRCHEWALCAQPFDGGSNRGFGAASDAPSTRDSHDGLPPDLFLEEFVEAGGNSFLVHWEGNENLHRTIQRIKELGKRAGVAINPATPAAVLEEILQDVEQVLVMTVNPGFGHQRFLSSTLPKIRRVRRMIERINRDCELEVDGGIDPETAPLAVAAGANVLVAGTAVFGERDGVAAAMNQLCASASVERLEKQPEAA